MLKPTGFRSYTSTDDIASRGRLSQLRRLLADELQAKIGREPKVQIFQDVAAIPYGANWERQITQALDQSSFFIPIVTPAFLHSEWCCHEAVQFRAHQQALGRDDLIFPLHYLDVGAFDTVRRQECHDPAVLDYLRTHQWIDFRRLRLLPLETSVEVAQKLDELAAAICATLYRIEIAAPPPPRVATPPPVTSPQTARPAPLPASSGALREDDDLPEMVLIPPGSFVMGVSDAESAREKSDDTTARPQHAVTFRRGFYLAKHQTTRHEFATFVADTGYQNASSDWRDPGFEQTERDPVVYVSAIDAEAYAA